MGLVTDGGTLAEACDGALQGVGPDLGGGELGGTNDYSGQVCSYVHMK